MWRYIGWPFVLMGLVAEAILLVITWQSGFMVASYEASKRETETASAAARELLDAHEQNIRLNMQMAELADLIRTIKHGGKQ